VDGNTPLQQVKATLRDVGNDPPPAADLHRA
jgi:hypothetical protein